jgi:two-component system phosphate regulon sensor histidine kinase PhoR
MSDITRIKQLEDLRRDFVANVSHELKTPITSIKGFVETLKDGAIDEPETAKHFLQIIENHSERLHLIIEDLLSLSRLEQFERSIQFNECLIGEIINSVKEVCEPKARAKAIQIKDNYSGSARIIGNANLLEQALINLIDNAIKYSSNNSRIEVNVATKSKLLKIEVHDHGQGIPQRDLPRIFERFYRVDRARSRDMGGTGLGLAIVKHIVLAHNGEIRVESTIGAGSNFIISIPQPPNSYGYT